MGMVVEVPVLDDTYTVNDRYFNGRSYLEWLESFTIDERIVDDRRNEYHKLIRALWSIDFKPSIGNDDDRAAEGIELRTRYNDILAKKSGDGEFVTPDVRGIFGECRVLEMLIALSMHMYDFMQDMNTYNSVSRWFWEIMENVSLDFLTDDLWKTVPNADDFVHDICEEIMQRKGRGVGRRYGWFSLYDWENMEIWYQMHSYLMAYICE